MVTKAQLACRFGFQHNAVTLYMYYSGTENPMVID